jgi:hypothetical protein
MIDWVSRLLESLGPILPIAIFLLVSLFGRGKKKAQSPGAPQQEQPARPSMPTAPAPASTPDFPMGPVTWPTMSPEVPAPRPQAASAHRDTTQWGSTFDRDDSGSGDSLKWGSTFDRNDARDEAPLKWGSVFDNQREKTKWGVDNNEWGSGFGPKKESEPKITIG